LRYLSVKSIIYYFLLISFVRISFSQTQPYRWPTDAGRLMTSSFCEFRPRHYHAAIDIKTWGRTGYKIFAISDGYVIRARVSAFGYGKALYLKLADGNITVYAHLERFWPALEQYMDNIRKKEKQYRVDLNFLPNQFPVKRGQILGYTGKSGIGVPHLHFEMRNPQNEPVNPLQYFSNSIKDNLNPQIYELALLPLDYKGLINLRPDTVYYSFRKGNQILLPDTLFLSGKIGILLKIHDIANGANNQFSFFKAQMWIDEKPVYTVQYDSFSYNETALVELDKNFSLWRKGLGIYHNFFRHRENTLPHYHNTTPEGGIINSDILEEGLHHLRITVDDFGGNQAEFQMYFNTGNPQLLQKEIFQNIKTSYFVRFSCEKQIQKIKIDVSDWIPLAKQKLFSELFLDNKFHYTFLLEDSLTTNSEKICLSGKTEVNTPSYPIFLSKYQSDTSRVLPDRFFLEKYRIKKNWLEISTLAPSNFAYEILSKLSRKLEDILWFQVDLNSFQIHFPINTLEDNREIFKAMFRQNPPEFTIIDPNENIQIRSQNGLLRAGFPENAFFENTAVFLKSYDSLSSRYDFPDPYQRIGLIYDLQPWDQPVNQGIYISLKPPISELNSAGLGIYYWDDKKGWIFIPSRRDSLESTFSARVTSLELFTLGQDTIPPKLLPAQKIQDGYLLSKNGLLTFMVKDEKSGIQKESQIQVFLNREWHLFNYDPEEDRMSINIPQNINNPALLQIRVVDNVGNVIQQDYRVK
jgi:hypothetical protein